MVEPTRRNLDRAIEESINLFGRAKMGTVTAVDPRRPKTVLLALDGSSQDPFSIAIARQFHKRFGCEVAVVDAREGDGPNDLAARVAQSLGRRAEPKTSADSYEQILAAVEHSICDLLITPCPYGRDLESVGPDSVGTVIDVLLARSPVPVLVVRKPYEPQDDLFRQAVIILTAENEAAPDAAAWAAGLIAPRGVLHLVLVLEREMYENIHALMQSIAPEMDVSIDSLSHALARNYMRLHRGLQKAAAEGGFEYKLNMQVEGEAGPIAAEDASRPTLRVLALERSDHATQGSVQARIRQSLHPVLVVCRQQFGESTQSEGTRSDDELVTTSPLSVIRNRILRDLRGPSCSSRR